MKAVRKAPRKETAILKVGGSVITNISETSVPNLKHISQIVAEVKKWIEYNRELRSIIMVIGAGSFGHPLAHRYGLNAPHTSEKSEYGIVLTVRKMVDLAGIVADEFIKAGMPAFPMQPSALFTLDRGRIVSADIERVRLALSRKLIPMFWGDAVLDLSECVRILSGDQIVTYLFEMLPAESMLFGTDVDGVFSGDPKKDTKAEKIDRIDDRNIDKLLSVSGSSKSYDVTEGLRGKLQEIRNVRRRPVISQIYNASIPGNTLKALECVAIGTIIELLESGGSAGNA